ncbi:hypothetical protein G1H11_23045 [Phytoactinopolyspora alkaliphila]|uniref:GNAT family N-acetyltransferase n=1 Tax=Phytoactinopolyspora alkaliphila TaxID=1783498 RepID=A0A6N9YT14_9ACTN|nr:hypothetical protein [Phytoactinopolyspora alkaliphila]NED98181.1 hypothetical protein [Phytoactinopolyspora alkaliphila]
MWIGFYRPADRYDLWEAYAEGARRTYRQYGAEHALTLLPADPESATPVFAVVRDDDGKVIAGWYANGPLKAVNQAFAPSEFAADPVSATMIAEWVNHVLPDGAIELKAGWVDSEAQQKGALANLVARSFVHGLHFFGVRYAFGTVAQHAARRWSGAGARPLPGIPPTAYPDERYLTSFYHWDVKSAFRYSTPEQRRLFIGDLQHTQPVPAAEALHGVAA